MIPRALSTLNCSRPFALDASHAHILTLQGAAALTRWGLTVPVTEGVLRARAAGKAPGDGRGSKVRLT